MHGPVNISLAAVPFPTDQHVIATTQELSEEFPFNLEPNSGDPIGIGALMLCYLKTLVDVD